jgi:alpha-D-xyloside xylohydrolase
MKKFFLIFCLVGCGFAATHAQIQTNAGVQYLQCMTKDVSTDFSDLSNTYFLADSLASFDVATASGEVNWKRYRLSPRQAFNLNGYWPVRMQMLDFPDAAYDNDPNLQLKIDFISDRCVRIRLATTPVQRQGSRSKEQEDPMFCDAFKERLKTPSSPWMSVRNGSAVVFRSPNAILELQRYPFRLVLKDRNGRILTQSRHIIDNDSTQVKLLPFNFIKRGSDNSRSVNPVFLLSPGERIYGCGESFTSLNKVGQKVHLSVTDPQGPETDGMYKPVPFYFSNRGYGIFMHTSAPVTADFGASYIGAQRLFMADEQIDLFVFFGSPKEILNEYTDITGKSPMLPLWSFGTWMSRITYFSQEEGLDIARQLRRHKIPSDVIHFDTGWFGVDWQCDYEFARDRFPDPVGMLKQLKNDGFHTCLWQLPYFTPKNRFFPEIIEKGLHVRNADGGMPYEDAVLDFTNPETVRWYQGKILGLLKQGVSTIKCDFGEAAPYNGFYHNGRGGLYEHNLYPLRYNKALFEVIDSFAKSPLSPWSGVGGEAGTGIIWARSAWAGSQRYALHWGGDAATNNIGMLGDLRGGLSFGLSGFSFWSHDMGGFVTASPEDIYRRWLPFGFLSSHTRAHGAPPTEPWLISESFTKAFRQAAEMKYKLMPYVYAQAKDCTLRGLPMVRALLVEFPEDPGAWLIEDEYMFGSQILVAPLMESGNSRTVYLPSLGERSGVGSKWIDYQTGKVYDSGWQTIQAGPIPAVILVRDGSVIPHAPLAQRTDQIQWDKLEMKTYKAAATKCTGLLFKPGDTELTVIER